MQKLLIVLASLFYINAAGFFSAEAIAKPLYQEGRPQYASTQESIDAALPAFSELVKYISKSVVNVSSESGDEAESEEELDEEDATPQLPRHPFFKQPHPSRSLGSGFIASEDGYIVTNYHVVQDAKKIKVRLVDEKTDYDAKLIGSDEKTDLALIKIEPEEKLQVLYFGDSDKVEVGQWVLAVGNQFQLGQSVTAGIVSAKARRVPTKISGPYDQFIQTDAAINPGSSGGPLVNTSGQVVGINTAIFSPGRQQFGGTGFNIGIGFAIPVNMAKGILTQLKEQGKVTRGLLGVIIQPVDANVAEALSLGEASGALVSDVVPGSPADKAGFRRRDVIVSFGGTEVEEHNDLPLMVANTPVGTEVPVGVLRDGKTVTLQPRIDELTGASFTQAKSDVGKKPDKLGLLVSEISEEISQLLGQPQPRGVVVREVSPNSRAAEAGIAPGDVIEEIGDKVVQDKRSYSQILKNLSDSKVVLVLIRRKQGTRFVTLD